MNRSTTFSELAMSAAEASIAAKRGLISGMMPALERAGALLLDAYRAGRKAIFFGNGGSAADAQHMAAEMEGRFAFDRRPLPALALHANVSTLTAVANDYAYEQVFARTPSPAMLRSPSPPAARRRTSWRPPA